MDYQFILGKLGKSKFRSSFHLNEKDKEYVRERGFDVIGEHAKRFLEEKIKIKKENDGRQTPMRGHPVFIAQHALALCCRSCIRKWYKIDENKELNEEEIAEFTRLVLKWIKGEIHNI